MGHQWKQYLRITNMLPICILGIVMFVLFIGGIIFVAEILNESSEDIDDDTY
jgi:hypothetical protein